MKLEAKGISADIIEHGLASFDADRAMKVIGEEISARIKKGDGPPKVGRFIASRGFEEETIQSLIEQFFDL